MFALIMENKFMFTKQYGFISWEHVYIDSSKCNFLTTSCVVAAWSTPVKRLVYPRSSMHEGAIA
jgi:hypothetical protein